MKKRTLTAILTCIGACMFLAGCGDTASSSGNDTSKGSQELSEESQKISEDPQESSEETKEASADTEKERQRKKLNIFLSNFAEQGMAEFDYGRPDAGDLADFAYLWTYINKWTDLDITAYNVFNKNTTEKIRKAQKNSTVKIETNKWFSFHKMVMEALAERPDVTFEISFLDEGYKGNRCTVVIPKGTDAMSLVDKNGFTGFLYLGGKFGMNLNQ